MQAVVFPSPNDMSLDQVPDPRCEADEVVVQVAQVGICGTDLHLYRNEYPASFPLIAGHEFAGQIVQVGPDVTRLQRGQRVAADPNLSCGACYFCRRQQANHCLNWQGIGITRPGAFAEYVAVPARACYPLPDTLTDTEAAFIEPLSCVVYALNRLRVWPGDEVLILGAGPMGLLLLQALQRSGAARVAVVEKQAHRRSLARDMGAAAAVDAAADQMEALRELAPRGQRRLHHDPRHQSRSTLALPARPRQRGLQKGSTTNAPPPSASTVRRSNWASSGPNCVTARRSPTATPSSTC